MLSSSKDLKTLCPLSMERSILEAQSGCNFLLSEHCNSTRTIFLVRVQTAQHTAVSRRRQNVPAHIPSQYVDRLSFFSTTNKTFFSLIFFLTCFCIQSSDLFHVRKGINYLCVVWIIKMLSRFYLRKPSTQNKMYNAIHSFHTQIINYTQIR